MGLPEPYYSDDWTTIYHADCLDVLSTLDVGCVDLLLTDPPYGVGYVTAWRSRHDPLRKAIEGDTSLDALFSALPLLDAALGENRHALLFASPLKVAAVQRAASLYWKIKNVLVWDKGEQGTVGDLEAGYGCNWEPVLYASKGRRALNGSRPRAILRYAWSGTRDPVHPTVKPVPLLQTLIARHSQPDELVLDPFCGSGTTLAAAKNTGRRAIGIEVDEHYCNIAARRLSQEVLALGI